MTRTFIGFDGVPHVSDVITNRAQEARLVARMKDALAGEMHRRQEVLRAAENSTNGAMSVISVSRLPMACDLWNSTRSGVSCG